MSPHADAVRALVQLPVGQLRAAVDARALRAPARATRAQLASLLADHAMRARAEADYRDTGIAFDARTAAYPHVRRLVTRHALRSLLDLGCGPGLFADELRARRALPRDGAYLGLDVSPAAIELAQARLAGDPRFTFRVGDAERLRTLRHAGVDGVVISFVLSYLDTRAVHRLLATLARRAPRAILIVALTFRSCVDRREGIEPDEARELRAARRYLAGQPSAAEARWDLDRLRHYRQSVETYYRITDEDVLVKQAQMLWVARPRGSMTRTLATKAPQRNAPLTARTAGL